MPDTTHTPLPKPVGAHHVSIMACRLSDAMRERAYAVVENGFTTEEYERAVRRHERRMRALGRLTYALENQWLTALGVPR